VERVVPRVSLDWHLLIIRPTGPPALVEDLNRAYRQEPALHQLDFQPAGFEWIDCNDSSIAFLACSARAFGEGYGHRCLQLHAGSRPNYRVGARREVLARDLEQRRHGVWGSGWATLAASRPHSSMSRPAAFSQPRAAAPGSRVAEVGRMSVWTREASVPSTWAMDGAAFGLGTRASRSSANRRPGQRIIPFGETSGATRGGCRERGSGTRYFYVWTARARDGPRLPVSAGGVHGPRRWWIRGFPGRCRLVRSASPRLHHLRAPRGTFTGEGVRAVVTHLNTQGTWDYRPRAYAVAQFPAPGTGLRRNLSFAVQNSYAAGRVEASGERLSPARAAVCWMCLQPSRSEGNYLGTLPPTSPIATDTLGPAVNFDGATPTRFVGSLSRMPFRG